jgi:fatty-acyl-CoA synthase
MNCMTMARVGSREAALPEHSAETEPRGVEARSLTLADLVEAAAEAAGSRTAIVLDDRSLSYGELWAGGERRARQMVALGLRHGDRVGVLLPNSLEYLEIVLGAAIIGAITVPMNIRYKARELAHLISDSGMVALFSRSSAPGGADFAALLGEALPGLDTADDPASLALAAAPALRTIVALGEAHPRFVPEDTVAPSSAPLPNRPGPADALLLMYTSGTTANPKGCIVPHRAILSNAWAIGDKFAITTEDVWWCPLPMFHIGGFLFAFVMLAARGIYVGMTYFNPDKALDGIERLPPTVFYPLFPTITLPIVDHPRFAALDHSRMRFMFNLAPPDLQRKIQAILPHVPLMGAFGMTETCGTVAYGSPDDPPEERFATCGGPLPGWEIRIVDPETREALPAGERGEIAVKGVGLFAGYLNEPELTGRQHTTDGFFLTGDVGSLDDDGRLTFHGRFKDQLKVGGENVSALEVESYLATHPAVSLAQVVGIADAKYGEVPAAFLELKPGATLTESEAIAFCRGKIAPFKVPRYVRFVEEWPMSATKIVKFRLKEALKDELAQAQAS